MRMMSGRIVSIVSLYPDQVKCIIDIGQTEQVVIVCGIRIIRDQKQISSLIHQIKGRKVNAIILNKKNNSSDEKEIQIVDYL